MAITYTRTITNLVTKDIVKDGQTLENCIVRVSWKHTGTDENNVSGTFHGTMSWDRNPDRYISADNFTAYTNVSEQNVWDWIDARTTDDYLQHQKDVIQAEIDRQSPSVEHEEGDFPWS